MRLSKRRTGLIERVTALLDTIYAVLLSYTLVAVHSFLENIDQPQQA